MLADFLSGEVEAGKDGGAQGAASADDPHCRHVEAFEAVAILVLL